MYTVQTNIDEARIDAKYVKMVDGAYFFYNDRKEEDIDSPIAIFERVSVIKIKKIKEDK